LSQERVSVSVIIPVYRAGEHFVTLLSELAAQEADFGYEVLVADDASTDDTVERIAQHLESLSKPFFRLIRLPSNTGPAGARNSAISHAQGEVLLLIDADCRVLSRDYLARVFEAHQLHPDAIIGGGVLGMGRGWVAFADRFCHWSTNIPGKTPAIIQQGHLVTANMAIPREVFEAVGPFPDLRTGEDSAFCFIARSSGVELRLHGALIVAHHDREDLGDFLRCFYWVGRDRLDTRETAYGRAPWFLKAPSRWFMAPLIAFGLTAKNLCAWLPHDKKVLLALPLIFLGMAAMATGVAFGPRKSLRSGST
jgi:glycosyltransferase involved in cell wall biosynthesis